MCKKPLVRLFLFHPDLKQSIDIALRISIYAKAKQFLFGKIVFYIPVKAAAVKYNNTPATRCSRANCIATRIRTALTANVVV